MSYRYELWDGKRAIYGTNDRADAEAYRNSHNAYIVDTTLGQEEKFYGAVNNFVDKHPVVVEFGKASVKFGILRIIFCSPLGQVALVLSVILVGWSLSFLSLTTLGVLVALLILYVAVRLAFAKEGLLKSHGFWGLISLAITAWLCFVWIQNTPSGASPQHFIFAGYLFCGVFLVVGGVCGAVSSVFE